MNRVLKVRWCMLSYRLPTLFVVVTVLACMAAWVKHQVHERHTMRSRIEASGGVFRDFQSGGYTTVRESDPSRRVSALRKLLGDNDTETIEFPHRPTEAEMEAAAFFPEAEVLSYIPDFLSSDANDNEASHNSESADSQK